ncbi:2-oxoglutarate-dependent dioxygenase DAO [Sesamum alatum]|uniref:2-oxoglutarate-dependent dioxygenase DAO n=1 Tax=Sesamum alatum TaxID=300844 RepID=A0AAE1XZT3_9LAMI|nr:2-oxoglutarate-dependent dioxygenase DAO [Sesamum alatum]
MNKYNYGPESVGMSGVIVHTDPGFLTILQDDENVSGLEVVDEITGDLVPVDPIPGTLVVNVGDVAKAWSNGRFRNVKHRVQCYEPTVRTSIALFVLAPKDEKVEAPPQLVDSDHPRRYIPFDFEEYWKLRTSTRSITGEALQSFLAKSS